MKKIDMHVHSRKVRAGALSTPVKRSNGTTYATAEELRAIYDSIGVEKGVLLPGTSPECAHLMLTNEDAYELACAYPDTFYWFCNLDPRMGTNSDKTDFSYFLNHYKGLGARGVGEITANLYFDDPRVWNLMAHCEACQMPILFHIGGEKNDYGLIDEIGLPRLEKSLARFPKLKFLGHSQKFWAEISPDVTEKNRNGYPQGPVRPGGRVVALMRKYENLCGDLSAGSGANAIMRDPAFGYAFIEEFQDRLFFGTDICAPENRGSFQLSLSAYLDKAVSAGHISKRAHEKVCRDNALAILNPSLA